MGKTVADLTPQELIKILTPAFGALIKAEIKTAQILNEAAIKASEEKLIKRIDGVEERLGAKIDKVTHRIDDHEDRISSLEEQAGIPKQN